MWGGGRITLTKLRTLRGFVDRSCLPSRPDGHPPGCHRRCIDDRIVFAELVAGLALAVATSG
jgi:hypothetical protein